MHTDLLTLHRDVAAAVDVAEAQRALTRAAAEITAPSAVSYWTADERAATLRLAALSDQPGFADLPATMARYGQGLVGEVAVMRKGIAVLDAFADGDAGMAEWHRKHGLRTCEGLPILFDDTLLGVLVYSRTTPLDDGADARDALAMVVDQAGIVIHNATRFEALLEANQQLSSLQSVDAVLSSIAEACGRVLGSASVSFRVVEGDELVLRGTWGDAEGMGLKPRMAINESLSGAVATSGRPLNIPNALDDPRHFSAHREALGRFGYRGWFGVPVKAGDRLLGTLSIHTRSADGASPGDLSVAMAFASQAAVALDNARLAVEHSQLYARLKDKTQRLEVLHRLALGLTASLGEQQVFTAVARGALELFGDVGCSLWVLEREGGDTMTLVADEGIRFPGLRKTTQMKVGQGLMGTVVADRRPVILENIQQRGHNQALSQAEGFVGAMGVPLLFGDRCYGGISVRRRSAEPFRQEDVELLNALAGHAATAIEQARLYEGLRAQTEALKARNAELDTFAYAVSHDLKAPLVTIQGMAGLLEMDFAEQLGTEGKHYIERMSATVRQMEHLIADVLQLSRVGREGRPAEPVQLDEVVDEVLDRLSDRIAARGVTVTRTPLGEVPAIRVQMEQVFANLVGNAVAYLGDTREPTIEIGRAGHEFYVRDNGIGIAPEHHAKVLEAFQRLQEIEVSGSGVGLAIVRKIVESAGGRLRIESASGAGATFFFTWPQTA